MNQLTNIFLVNVILNVLSLTVVLSLLYLPQNKLLEGKLEYEAMKSKGGLHSDISDVFEYSNVFKCNFVKIGSDNITTVFYRL